MVGSQINADQNSVEQCLHSARSIMMDTLSTVAIEQETGNLVGFLISGFNELRPQDPEFRKQQVIKTTSKLLTMSIYIIQNKYIFIL